MIQYIVFLDWSCAQTWAGAVGIDRPCLGKCSAQALAKSAASLPPHRCSFSMRAGCCDAKRIWMHSQQGWGPANCKMGCEGWTKDSGGSCSIDLSRPFIFLAGPMFSKGILEGKQLEAPRHSTGMDQLGMLGHCGLGILCYYCIWMYSMYLVYPGTAFAIHFAQFGTRQASAGVVFVQDLASITGGEQGPGVGNNPRKRTLELTWPFSRTECGAAAPWKSRNFNLNIPTQPIWLTYFFQSVARALLRLCLHNVSIHIWHDKHQKWCVFLFWSHCGLAI